MTMITTVTFGKPEENIIVDDNINPVMHILSIDSKSVDTPKERIHLIEYNDKISIIFPTKDSQVNVKWMIPCNSIGLSDEVEYYYSKGIGRAYGFKFGIKPLSTSGYEYTETLLISEKLDHYAVKFAVELTLSKLRPETNLFNKFVNLLIIHKTMLLNVGLILDFIAIIISLILRV